MTAPQMPTFGDQPKNKIVAAALAFFFGTFGVHNFYLGYTKRGAYQLGLAIAGIVLSIVVIGVFLLSAAAIWGFVEFVMILIATPDQMYSHDANGVPLASLILLASLKRFFRGTALEVQPPIRGASSTTIS